MTASILYWLIMLLWMFGLLPSLIAEARAASPEQKKAVVFSSIGSDLAIFLLFVLIGWHVFGAPIHG